MFKGIQFKTKRTFQYIVSFFLSININMVKIISGAKIYRLDVLFRWAMWLMDLLFKDFNKGYISCNFLLKETEVIIWVFSFISTDQHFTCKNTTLGDFPPLSPYSPTIADLTSSCIFILTRKHQNQKHRHDVIALNESFSKSTCRALW